MPIGQGGANQNYYLEQNNHPKNPVFAVFFCTKEASQQLF